MAVIAPLKGVRYDTEVAGSLEDIVTPPYDVISRNEEASYYSRSPFNIITGLVMNRLLEDEKILINE